MSKQKSRTAKANRVIYERAKDSGTLRFGRFRVGTVVCKNLKRYRRSAKSVAE